MGTLVWRWTLEEMSIGLTRQELYDRVWAEPIDKLCKEFGISDVGLAKACRRHSVPVPPRGYWQRKAAGYADRRPALPKLTEGSEIITLLASPRSESTAEEQTSAVNPLIAFERQPENRVVVPDDLRSTHLAIKQTREYWAAEKRGEISYGENKLPHLNLRVSSPALPRALRLLQALFVALEQRGHTVAATNDGKTSITVLDETFDVSLREPSKQVKHVPTAQELASAKKYSWFRPKPYDLVASGTLVLTIESVWGVRHTWKEGKTQRLEVVLNDVIVGLLEAAFQKKARRAELERERLKAEELERQREVARQDWRQERARIRRLERLREATGEHQRLHEFVVQLRDTIGDVDADSEIGRWLTWADDHVRRLDPLNPFRAPQATIRLYYLGSKYPVSKIMSEGFTDRDPESGEDEELPTGVALTDAPMTRNGYDEATLVVDFPEIVVLPYEWITKTRNYRRFLVPAAVVNEHGRISSSEEEP